jgi:hypothetical protein
MVFIVARGRQASASSRSKERSMRVPEVVEERWQVLCRSVMDEKDPKRLLELVQELNRELELLDKKQNDDAVGKIRHI